MYTIKQVAKEFGVCHWTVRKWISSNKIEAGKGLGGIGISDEEVERLREEKTGRNVATNCILSPRPKNHPRRKSKGRRPWEE